MVQKRRSTAIRKQQIIDAARKLIIRKGSEHLTVRAHGQGSGPDRGRHLPPLQEQARDPLLPDDPHHGRHAAGDGTHQSSNGMESLDTVDHAAAPAPLGDRAAQGDVVSDHRRNHQPGGQDA
ncbi:MAG: hypothetical protein MZV70_64455 [Desulfobacterales bacterium]|nr:hypothetical protein [Desulfobacterales bacterium]